MKKIFLLLALVSSACQGQYDPNTLGGLGSDSVNLTYIRAFGEDSTIRLQGRIHLQSQMPEAGVVANFWKTYTTGATDSNSTSEVCKGDSILIGAGGLAAGMSLKIHSVFLFGHTNQTPNCQIRLKWGDNNLDSTTFYPAAVSGNTSPMIVDWWVTITDSVSGRVSNLVNYYDGNGWKTVGSTSMFNFNLWSGDFNNNSNYLHFSSKWNSAVTLNKTRITFIYGEYSDKPN